MAFKDKLKKLRAKHNLKQQDIADLLQISRSAISGYESKNKEPDFVKLIELADKFEVSIDYLLDRKPNSKTENIMEYITQNEYQILAQYRLLSDENKIRISERMEILLSTQKKI